MIDDRADGTVLHNPYQPESELPLVQVGKRPAVLRTCLIDTAASLLEKTAGHVPPHVSALLVGQPEALSDQLGFINAEIMGEPPDIVVRKLRRDKGAAVRAGAAIDAGRNILQMPSDETVEGGLRQLEALEI